MREYGVVICFVCLEDRTLSKKRPGFKIFFVTQLGHCLSTIAFILNIYLQGCQLGPFGTKSQKFGPKWHFPAPKFSFGLLALIGPFSRGWPHARIKSDHPGSWLRNHIFSLFWLIHCRFSPNSYILKVFYYKILLGSLEFLSYVKVIPSEYLVLTAVVEVAVRTVTLPNLLFFR